MAREPSDPKGLQVVALATPPARVKALNLALQSGVCLVDSNSHLRQPGVAPDLKTLSALSMVVYSL